jgi:hypothetical protein
MLCIFILARLCHFVVGIFAPVNEEFYLIKRFSLHSSTVVTSSSVSFASAVIRCIRSRIVVMVSNFASAV